METIKSQRFSGLWLEKANMCSTEKIIQQDAIIDICQCVKSAYIYSSDNELSQNGGDNAMPMLIHGL